MTNHTLSDLRLDRSFFGRKQELSELLAKLSRGRHVLVTGERGIGKTRLIKEALDILSGKKRTLEYSLRRTSRGHFPKFKIAYVHYSFPLSVCLKELLGQLHANGDIDPTHVAEDGKVKGLIPDLQRIAFESMRGKNYLVVLDNLDHATAAAHRFLEPIMELAVVCAATSEVRSEVELKKFWSSFSRIELESLPEPVCLRMIDYFNRSYPIIAKDKALYTKEILKSSNGNPFHIKTMLWHGNRQRFVDMQEIRKLRKVDEARYFNLGPVYVFGLIFFTLSKILIIGTGNKEFYIFLSVLGLLAYMTFRVFRRFFLFLPQRKKY